MYVYFLIDCVYACDSSTSTKSYLLVKVLYYVYKRASRAMRQKQHILE